MPADFQPPFRSVQRLAFRRGKFHALMHGALAVLLAGLFLVYVVGIQCLGIFIGWGVVLTMQAVEGIDQIGKQTLSQLGFLVFASIFWLGMLRPLRRRVTHDEGALQVSVNSQPKLAKTLMILSHALGLKGTPRLLIDGGPTIEAVPPVGLRAVWRGDTLVKIGLPMVSILSAKELASCLAMSLCRGTAGLGGVALRFVLGMDSWFRHSLERDSELNPLEARPYSVARNPFKFLVGTVLWLSQRPFWVLMLVGCGAGWLVRRMQERDAQQVGAQLIGEDGLDYLAFKERLLHQVWPEVTAAECGGRLGNPTQMARRRVTAELGKLAPFVARHRSVESPLAAGVISHLPPEAAGEELIQPFEDLAWQLAPTCKRGNPADGCSAHSRARVEEMGPTLRQVEALAVIRRYFGGLMHPERSLCGLGTAVDEGAGVDILVGEVLASRRWEMMHGSKMRTLVKEWNLAWKRRRDHEVAWAYSLAGFTVCHLDQGGGLSAVEIFRRESAAQRKIMDHLEDAIRSCEAKLEQRFSAALALLWGADPAVLPGRLREMRRSLPLWASVYESLSGVLPEFRELLTTFFTFQSFADRVTGARFTGAIASASQAVVPGLMARTHQLLRALDGACYPFAADGVVITMRDYLCEGSNVLSLKADTHVGVGMHSMVQHMVSETSLALTPVVTRFLELHHRSFAWLSAAAEASELHFVGPAELRDFNGAEGESFVHLMKPVLNVDFLETATV